MPDTLEEQAIRRLFNQEPGGVRYLPGGHGQTNGGAVLWDEAHPDDLDVRGCCWGEADKGAAYCTCWEPVFDVAQADPVPAATAADVQVRPDGMCGDCAYRPGSPERTDESLAETLQELPLNGQTFWCHDGARRPTSWRHPDGRTIHGSPADYQPPTVAGVPYRTDGSPCYLCAGWSAACRRWDNQIDKESRDVPEPDRAPRDRTRA